MKSKQLNELMIPISEYATIHDDADMAEAFRAFENETKRFGDAPYRHLSLIVIDDNNHVVGRLSQVDMMRALEPKYKEIGESRWIGRTMLSKKVLETLNDKFQFWEQPLDKLFQAVGNSKVKAYMQKPTEGEFVSENDTLNVAIHRIVMGHHHSLLVVRDKEIVGVLRSTDLFNTLYDLMAVSM
jgi:CBS-domain-containing membrane protein